MSAFFAGSSSIGSSGYVRNDVGDGVTALDDVTVGSDSAGRVYW